MERNNFARIGKGVLSKAIGLQENYKTYYEKTSDQLDINKSGCHNCPVHNAKEHLLILGCQDEADRIHEMCRGCSDSVWNPVYTQKVYVNEKNRYGYQPTLKVNSIKLLLLYHFLQPDTHGFVKGVRISDLAEALGCTVATVHSCNRKLQEYNYCYTSPGWDDGTITVYLPEYKDYHKPASEGGRGYITMSDEMLTRILGLTGLNTLRLNLKAVLLVDNASANVPKSLPLPPVSAPYSSLRGFLPKYCKRNVIRKSLEVDDSIFATDFHDKVVVFQIREQFAQRKMRTDMIAETAEELKTYVDNLNDVLEAANDAALPDEQERFRMMLDAFHVEPFKNYPSLDLSLSDLKDLASLAVQYNIRLVQVTIGHIYSQFICRHHSVDSIGALARTIIRRNLVFSKSA